MSAIILHADTYNELDETGAGLVEAARTRPTLEVVESCLERGLYVVVGRSELLDPEDIWTETQNGLKHESWAASAGAVRPVASTGNLGEVRSTDFGDLIVVGKRTLLCMPMGFSELPVKLSTSPVDSAGEGA